MSESVYKDDVMVILNAEFGMKHAIFVPTDKTSVYYVTEQNFFDAEGMCSNHLVADVLKNIAAADKWKKQSDKTISAKLKASNLKDVYTASEFIQTIDDMFVSYLDMEHDAVDYLTKNGLEFAIVAMEHRVMLYSLDYWDERGKYISSKHRSLMAAEENPNLKIATKKELKPLKDVNAEYEKYCKNNKRFGYAFGGMGVSGIFGLIKKYFGNLVLMSFQENSVFPAIFQDVCQFFNDLESRGQIRVASLGALAELAKSLEEDDEEDDEEETATETRAPSRKEGEQFSLTGRHELTKFFNENIIDVVDNEEVYARFGIGFPEPFVLEGPPGCGKTYAVERLTDFLGWKQYHVTSSSIGSTLIHETSKKTEEVFAKAAKTSPSVVVIDEMDAFMPDRGKMRSTDTHHTEEVAAFLKCIQGASSKKVLVIGMTNMIDNIDPAILRSGRMGKHLKVAMPSKEEIVEVIEHELEKRPHVDIDSPKYADKFIDKPLSDVVALVREASMIAARKRAQHLLNEHLDAAWDEISKVDKAKEGKTIGFFAGQA